MSSNVSLIVFFCIVSIVSYVSAKFIIEQIQTLTRKGDTNK